MAGSQSLERGLDILELLDKSPTPLGVREIARRLGLSATIVQRLVNTLAEFSYVVQDAETKRYGIGYRALGLGWSMLHKDRLISVAHPHLERLAAEHQLNAYLGKLRGNRVIYLLAIQSAGPIAIRSTPGSQAYLHSTALGKVLLAGLSPEAARALLGSEPLPQLTPDTVTDIERLMEQVEQVRRTGVSLVESENIAGVTSVGAPIRNHGGEVVAALSVAYAHWSDAGLTVETATALTVDCVRQISQEMGYSGQ